MLNLPGWNPAIHIDDLAGKLRGLRGQQKHEPGSDLGRLGHPEMRAFDRLLDTHEIG